MIIGIHLSVPSSRRNCKLGSKCAFWHTGLAGADAKNRYSSVVAAKKFDYTQAADQIT